MFLRLFQADGTQSSTSTIDFYQYKEVKTPDSYFTIPTFCSKHQGKLLQPDIETIQQIQKSYQGEEADEGKKQERFTHYIDCHYFDFFDLTFVFICFFHVL